MTEQDALVEVESFVEDFYDEFEVLKVGSPYGSEDHPLTLKAVWTLPTYEYVFDDRAWAQTESCYAFEVDSILVAVFLTYSFGPSGRDYRYAVVMGGKKSDEVMESFKNIFSHRQELIGRYLEAQRALDFNELTYKDVGRRHE